MDEHQSQLRQVEEALKLVTNPSEVQSLRSLRADLIELIELTRQTTNSNNENENKSIQSDKVNDEIQLFMSEINQVNTVNTSQVNQEKETEEDLMKELRAMIGHKCSAPHNHSWGNVTYHNAIICGIEEPTYVPINSNEIRMRILFTNPTHREMIPCSYFLEGECRFESDKCHFSHGELVRFTELKEYKEPEFEKLARNCIVLAKMKDRIWHKGRVLCANFEEKNCRVRLENQKKEIDFPFEDLFPIFHDEDLSDEFSSSNSTSDSEAVNEFEEARCARLVEQSLFSYAPTQALGEWEKHTKGIGSKLMAKMGYIQGTGLGSDGRGIITPITAQILPQGKSLDHCMELREAANGDQNLFSVEKKIKREQKKQETLSAKAYQRECKKIDVFSFLNTTILTNPNKKKQLSNEISSKSETRNLFKNQSTKNLNVESVRIADDIRKKEKEILKMKESMGRHTRGSEVHKRLQVQLMEKYQELGSLKKTESSLAKEQASRKTKNKLCVF